MDDLEVGDGTLGACGPSEEGELMGYVVKGVAWIPALTASKMLKCSRQRVYRLIDTGRLSAKTVDGTVLVSVESVIKRIQAQLLLPGCR